VQKVFRSLPSIFNTKKYAIEELKDLDKLTMDELLEILIANEMRIEKDKASKLSSNKATFKASKRINTEEYKTSGNSNSKSDVDEANFVRKLKRGTRKYQGNIPFK
jgi:DNA replication protein DnaD